MPQKSTKKSLSKTVRPKLSKEQARLNKTKKEVLERGAKHKKPIMLAKRRVVKLTLSILASVAALFIVAIGLLIYVGKNDGVVVYRTSQIIPFPAAKVNGSFVSYADYLFEVRYRKNIYANPTGPASASQEPVDFNTDEGKKLLKEIQASAMDRAKAKAIIKQLASDAGLSVEKDELEDGINELMERQGGREKFIEAIGQFYSWNLDDFRDEFRLQLLQQKLELHILPEYSQDQRKLAVSLVAKAKAGEDFAKLAKEYSEDPGSQSNGGDLGFVSADTPYVQEFKDAALKLKQGEVSEVVVTQFGFHIIKATATKGSEVRVSHILIEFDKNMEAVLKEELSKASVTNFVSIDESTEPKKETENQN